MRAADVPPPVAPAPPRGAFEAIVGWAAAHPLLAFLVVFGAGFAVGAYAGHTWTLAAVKEELEAQARAKREAAARELAARAAAMQPPPPPAPAPCSPPPTPAPDPEPSPDNGRHLKVLQ